MKKFRLLALFATQIFAFSASKFVNDARSQIGVTLSYDPSYEKLAYPMIDVDIKKAFILTTWQGCYVIKKWIAKAYFKKFK